MKDLIDFKNARIEALQNELFKKELRITNLETYIFELTDKDCPEDYKRIIKNELLKTE